MKAPLYIDPLAARPNETLSVICTILVITDAYTIDTSYYPQIPDSINTSKAITGSVSLSTATFQIHLEAA